MTCRPRRPTHADRARPRGRSAPRRPVESAETPASPATSLSRSSNGLPGGRPEARRASSCRSRQPHEDDRLLAGTAGGRGVGRDGVEQQASRSRNAAVPIAEPRTRRRRGIQDALDTRPSIRDGHHGKAEASQQAMRRSSPRTARGRSCGRREDRPTPVVSGSACAAATWRSSCVERPRAGRAEDLAAAVTGRSSCRRAPRRTGEDGEIDAIVDG